MNNNQIKEYKVIDNKKLTLESISYSIDSTTGKVYRKSIFVSNKQYILTVEKTNDENNLEVKEYQISDEDWKELNNIISKYDISNMSIKKIINSSDEIKNIDLSYTNKKEKTQYVISSNMELSIEEENIFTEINDYLEKIENNNN